MHLTFIVIGLVLILLGFVFGLLARANRHPNVGGITFRPIWKLRDHYTPAGYRYLWASTLSIVAAGVLGLVVGLS